MTISFYVSGEPKAQPRPRAFARKMGDKFVARVYDAGTAENWKTTIADAARKAKLDRFTGAVALDMHFNFKRPKSHFTAKGLLKESAPQFHEQRPDWDNLGKAVADALTILEAWADDAQIVDVRLTKNWSWGHLPGGCHITIASFDGI